MGFLVKYRYPIIFLFYLFQFTWFYSRSSLLALGEVDLLAWLSLSFILSFWLILLFDMMTNPISNKTFWLFSMLILPWFAPALYLFQRKRLTSLPTSLNIRKRKGS